MGARQICQSDPTHDLRFAIDALRKKFQQEGKRAFDRNDPIAARKEEGRLEQIDTAEEFSAELDGSVDSLGADVTTYKPLFVAESKPSGHKPNKSRKGAKRLAERALHPPQLIKPVIDVLRELGGEGHHRDIWSAIERRLGSTFTGSDLEQMKSSNIAWWAYNVQWTLTNLKTEGRVEHAGKRGVWRLTASN